MGMSASQMRYCLLTGRQTDLQFQGQQINQQRTTLATETSTYNNQLLTLSVPTPPNSSDYTKTTYSFTSTSGETCEISGLDYNDGTTATLAGTQPGRWTINYTTTGKGPKGELYGQSTVTQPTAGSYYINGNALTPVDMTSLSTASPTKEDLADRDNLSHIYDNLGVGTATPTPGAFYKYTDSKNNIQYILASSLPTGTSGSAYTYYVNSEATVTKSDNLNNAEVHFSDSGRMTDIEVKDAGGNTIYSRTLTVNSTNDDTAYKNAMNEYEYKKGIYEKSMNDINSKIDVVQEEDKKLQLKLQDLDTQNKAIQTEIESVKKVVEKNVEQSFKAFA